MLDLALDVQAAPSRMLSAEVDALVEDIDQVIALEDRPSLLGSDLAFEAEVAELMDYVSLVKLPSVSLVIPTLNEEANIGWVLQRVPAWVEEVIVVDGGSRDRTVEGAKTLRPDGVVVTELRKGKGVALRAGFATANRDVFEIETEIVVNSLRRGMRIAEIPSHEAERLNGESHLHPVRDGLRVLSTIIRARFSRLQCGPVGPPSLAQDSIG